MKKKATPREIRINQLKKYSKMDLIILLADTEFVIDVLAQPTRKKAKKVWDDYMNRNQIKTI